MGGGNRRRGPWGFPLFKCGQNAEGYMLETPCWQGPQNRKKRTLYKWQESLKSVPQKCSSKGTVIIVQGQSAGNQRSLRHALRAAQQDRVGGAKPVGSSETTRLLISHVPPRGHTKSMSNLHNKSEWNNWFAGFIDGDGSILVYKDHVSIEATTSLEDEGILCEIKKHFGGSVKSRANARALRWRSRKKDVVLKVLKSLNGYLRHSIRRKQFIKACEFYGVQVLPDKTLTNSYYAGLFDADGTICISVLNWDKKKELACLSGNYGKAQRMLYSRGHNQCVIKFTNKYHADCKLFADKFGIGSLYFEKGKCHSKWLWVLKQDEIHAFINGVLLPRLSERGRPAGLRGRKKKNRCRLIQRYLDLKAIKAHLAQEDTEMFKEWKNFCYKWYSLA